MRLPALYGLSELAARQGEGGLQFGRTAGGRGRAVEFGEYQVDVGRRRIAKLLLQSRDLDAQRRHRISQVVKDTAGILRDAGIEGAVYQLAPRIGQMSHHPIELAR